MASPPSARLSRTDEFEHAAFGASVAKRKPAAASRMASSIRDRAGGIQPATRDTCHAMSDSGAITLR